MHGREPSDRVPVSHLQREWYLRRGWELPGRCRLHSGQLVQRERAHLHAKARERRNDSERSAPHEPDAEWDVHDASRQPRLRQRRLRHCEQRMRLRDWRRPVHAGDPGRLPVGRVQRQRNVRAAGRLQCRRRLRRRDVVQRERTRLHAATSERIARPVRHGSHEPDAERHVLASGWAPHVPEPRLRHRRQQVRLCQRRRPVYRREWHDGLPLDALRDHRSQRRQMRRLHDVLGLHDEPAMRSDDQHVRHVSKRR